MPGYIRNARLNDKSVHKLNAPVKKFTVREQQVRLELWDDEAAPCGVCTGAGSFSTVWARNDQDPS